MKNLTRKEAEVIVRQVIADHTRLKPEEQKDDINLTADQIHSMALFCAIRLESPVVSVFSDNLGQFVDRTLSAYRD